LRANRERVELRANRESKEAGRRLQKKALLCCHPIKDKAGKRYLAAPDTALASHFQGDAQAQL
jgi:hypothetical protein